MVTVKVQNILKLIEFQLSSNSVVCKVCHCLAILQESREERSTRRLAVWWSRVPAAATPPPNNIRFSYIQNMYLPDPDLKDWNSCQGIQYTQRATQSNVHHGAAERKHGAPVICQPPLPRPPAPAYSARYHPRLLLHLTALTIFSERDQPRRTADVLDGREISRRTQFARPSPSFCLNLPAR